MLRSSVFRTVAHCFRTLSLVVFDLVRLAFLAAHSRSALAAENLFLRKQLALFQERTYKLLDHLIPNGFRTVALPIQR